MGMWLGIISYQILWKEPILEAHSTGIKVEEIYMSTTFWTWSRKLETGNMKRELRNGRRILHDDNWELIERVYLHLGPPWLLPPPQDCILAHWGHVFQAIGLIDTILGFIFLCFALYTFTVTIFDGLISWLSRKKGLFLLGIWGVNRFECQPGPQGPGIQSLSVYPGPGGSWDRGVSAILPASTEAESPSCITIPYQYHPPPPTIFIMCFLQDLQKNGICRNN